MSMTEETYALRLPRAATAPSGAGAPHPAPAAPARPDYREIARFLGVGVVGYAVNLLAFAALVHLGGVEYRASAVLSFGLALTATFFLNRHFTFGATDGSLAAQAWRSIVVNAAGFATNLLVLQCCVELLAFSKVPGEALAAAAAAPVNYLGGRLWAFRR